MTQELIGRTVYIEYASSGWRGYWMGAKDNYDGAVFQVSEHSVFDPNQPCRINVIDCGGGWACLRTRYKEGTRAQGDSYAYFLEATTFGADFALDTAEGEYKGSEFKWRFKCGNTVAMENCFIESKSYSGGGLTIHNDHSLDWVYPDWLHPDDWFEWRIMRPKFESRGMGSPIGSGCNMNGTDITLTLSFTKGISVTTGFNFHFSESISTEVKESAIVKEASGTVGAEWGAEFDFSTTWSEHQRKLLLLLFLLGTRLKSFGMMVFTAMMNIFPMSLKEVIIRRWKFPAPCDNKHNFMKTYEVVLN